MTAQVVQHESDTSPGGKLKVSVWVWSTTRASSVHATVATSAHALLAPRFTLCPVVSHGSTCSIGGLPANNAVELMVTDRVRSTATIGRPIALAITVTAKSFSPAEAAIAAVVGQGIQPPTSPLPLPPTTLIPLPGATITPAGLSGLFPTVTPQPSPPPSNSPRAHKPRRVVEASSALPLSSRLIGGQLAGLAVLAAAITMVVARLSLRTAQAPAGAGAGAGDPVTGDPGSGGSGTGESEADASAPDGEAGDNKADS